MDIVGSLMAVCVLAADPAAVGGDASFWETAVKVLGAGGVTLGGVIALGLKVYAWVLKKLGELDTLRADNAARVQTEIKQTAAATAEGAKALGEATRAQTAMLITIHELQAGAREMVADAERILDKARVERG